MVLVEMVVEAEWEFIGLGLGLVEMDSPAADL